MTSPMTRSPLSRDRSYRDRKGRVWKVLRVTNAGRGFTGAILPALALITCLDPAAACDVDTRHPQWVYADTGQWSDGCTSTIDLVGPA